MRSIEVSVSAESVSWPAEVVELSREWDGNAESLHWSLFMLEPHLDSGSWKVTCCLLMGYARKDVC